MTTTLKISGMSCGHCVMHVKKALAEVSGITDMKVEVGSAVLTGEFSVDAVKSAIEEEGYEVVSVA